MKVCKFGGSSLADAGQLTKVIDMKVTDLLIALAKYALDGKNTASALDAVVARYAEIAKGLDLGDEIVQTIRDDLQARLAQVPKDGGDAGGFMDLLKAAGEDNNAKLVTIAFQKRGKKARYASPKETGMVLEGESGNATLDPESYKKLSRAFADFAGIVVYPGFFGYRADGSVATFPRGGSDITGSILAAAVRADVRRPPPRARGEDGHRHDDLPRDARALLRRLRRVQ